jgi:hypothetical protein
MGNQQAVPKENPPAGNDGATSGTSSPADPLSPTTMWRWDTSSQAQSDPMSPTTKCIKQKMKDPAVMN